MAVQLVKTVDIHLVLSKQYKGDDGLINNVQIYFAKVKPSAIIPTKRKEDAGYDVYAHFEENDVLIPPTEIKLIPTGIASAFSSDYVLIAKERGSSGSKGMAIRMGVVDSGYRGEIIIGINNTTSKSIVITKDEEKTRSKIKTSWEATSIKINEKAIEKIINDNYIFYPYDKAIAQLILLPVPSVTSKEIPYKELLSMKSERGTGKLGSSGK